MIYNNENFTEQNDGERSKDWQKKTLLTSLLIPLYTCLND